MIDPGFKRMAVLDFVVIVLDDIGISVRARVVLQQRASPRPRWPAPPVPSLVPETCSEPTPPADRSRAIQHASSELRGEERRPILRVRSDAADPAPGVMTREPAAPSKNQRTRNGPPAR